MAKETIKKDELLAKLGKFVSVRNSDARNGYGKKEAERRYRQKYGLVGVRMRRANV